MTNSRYTISPTKLDGVMAVTRKRVGDERGYLERVYCDRELQGTGFNRPIRQINRTVTREVGVVRGLHFQRTPYAEGKFVSCVRGSVFDVAVDLRRDSPTFLRWHGEVLSDGNATSLYIPEGFAHGFQTLTDNVEMLYLHTEYYTPEAEGGLNALDPVLAIDWPMPPVGMSLRDRAHPMLTPEQIGTDR